MDALQPGALARANRARHHPLDAVSRLRSVGGNLRLRGLSQMNLIASAPDSIPPPPAVGCGRIDVPPWEPLFLADWDRVLMVHYEIAPAALQPFVPFELDLREGWA